MLLTFRSSGSWAYEAFSTYKFHSERGGIMTFSQSFDAWQSRMNDFQIDCASCAAVDQSQRLREAADLLPSDLVPRLADFEAMLECGAYESAAMLLLGKEVTFMFSRGADGFCLASAVAGGGSGKEITGEGSAPALALLAAYAGVLLGNAGACGVRDDSIQQPGLSHLN